MDRCLEGKMTCGRKLAADMTLEDILEKDYPALWEKAAGLEVNRERKHLRFRVPGQENYTRCDTLKGDYTEQAIKEWIAGTRTVKPRHAFSKKPVSKVGLLVDIEAAIRSGKGPGYERWAKVFNLKQLSQAVLYLKEHGDMGYEDLLEQKRKAYSAYKQAKNDMKELHNVRANVVFTPVLPAIIGAGLVKSVLAIAVLLGADTESMTYYFLNFIGDAPLYFLPVMLAFTAAKKLGCNQFLAVAIAGAMLHPNYTALITDAYSIHFNSFLEIPVTLASYSSSVIPVLLMVFALKYMEAFLEKILPKMVKFFFKPLLCLLIVAPVTFIVLGPIGFVVGVGISTALNFLNEHIGWLVPTIIGAIYPLMLLPEFSTVTFR